MANTINSKEYVVLDVETNGLSSRYCDLLSISLYRPDTNTHYDRFLPLELESDVYTTWINGIKKKDLKNKAPLSQDEVNSLIKDFELDKRIILTYGRIDRTFLQQYFIRHKLEGFHLFRFYNFKKSIISSQFSRGIVTKDALCNVFNIDGVSDIHSGRNDCVLEWKLFKKMNNEKLFIDGHQRVYRFSDDYIIPASYLSLYPNFKYHSDSCVDATARYRVLKRFEVRSPLIQKFEMNINGVAMEHLLSSLLDAKEYKKEEKEMFLASNKKKLKYIGKIPSDFDDLLVTANKDGSLNALDKKDEEFVKRINLVLEEYRKGTSELIVYLKKNIFKNKAVRYQELTIKPKTKTLAICDFSTEDSILEMKTFGILKDDKVLPSQLYYQADGRNMYILSVEWLSNGVNFIISKVLELNATKKEIKPLIYQSKKKPKKAHRRRNRRTKAKKVLLTEEQKWERRFERYKRRLAEKSNNSIQIINYVGSRTDTTAKCLKCGNIWSARSDKIADRGCPKCRKTHYS